MTDKVTASSQKIRKSPSEKTVKSWLDEFPELVLEGDRFKCTTCNATLSCKTRAGIVKHRSQENHKSFGSNETNATEQQESFNKELVKFIVGCKIPWKRLESPCFQQFIKKCISGKFGVVRVPTESTLKNNYILKRKDSSPKPKKSKVTPKKIKKNILKVKIGSK